MEARNLLWDSNNLSISNFKGSGNKTATFDQEMSSTVPKKGNISQFESEIEPPQSLQSTCNASSDLRGFTSSSSPELSELEGTRATLSKSFKKPPTIQGSVEETECLQEGFSCTTAVRKEGANFQSSPALSPVALECCYVTLKKSPVASTADQRAFEKSSQKVSGDKYPGTDGSGSEKVQVVDSSAVLPSEVSGVTAGEVTVTFCSSQDKSECNLCVTEMVASSRPNGELCNNTSVSATTPLVKILRPASLEQVLNLQFSSFQVQRVLHVFLMQSLSRKEKAESAGHSAQWILTKRGRQKASIIHNS